MLHDVQHPYAIALHFLRAWERTNVSLLRTACMLAMSFTILCIFELCTPLVRVCRQGNEDIACQVSISPIAEAAAQWRNDAQVTFQINFGCAACLSTRHEAIL